MPQSFSAHDPVTRQTFICTPVWDGRDLLPAYNSETTAGRAASFGATRSQRCATADQEADMLESWRQAGLDWRGFRLN